MNVTDARQCPAAVSACIAEARDSIQLPWLTNVMFCVTGFGIFGTRDRDISRRRTRAPGWMLVMLNVNGRSPFSAAFFSLAVGDVRLRPADATLDHIALVRERNRWGRQGCSAGRSTAPRSGCLRREPERAAGSAARARRPRRAAPGPSRSAKRWKPCLRLRRPMAARAATLVAIEFTVFTVPPSTRMESDGVITTFTSTLWMVSVCLV